jgi:protein-tyrosine phosphatase
MTSLSLNAGRYNLRDYGGYRAASGGRLRRGVLLRSGELDNILPEDHGLLARLGVGSVIDLRSANEIAESRSPAFAGFAGAVRMADSEDGVIPHAVQGLMRLTAPDQVSGRMISTYRLLPQSPRFRQGLGLYLDVLENGDGASLIHCFAGKDRTGLAVALFQMMAGVHQDDVMAEYLLTNATGEERIASGIAKLKRQADPAIRDAVRDDVLVEAMAVRPDYLASALAVIAAENASPAAWIAQATGIDKQRQERIRQRFLA